MIQLYQPQLTELWFRKELLGDEDTMSYNRAWGGTISFPQEKWEAWYARWITNCGNQRFYRYLLENTKGFIGEAAYHYDAERQIYLADVIVMAKHRDRGYGSAGLELLCSAAKENGIQVLHDDIARGNPSVSLFLKNGFVEEYRTDEIVMVKKVL